MSCLMNYNSKIYPYYSKKHIKLRKWKTVSASPNMIHSIETTYSYPGLSRA